MKTPLLDSTALCRRIGKLLAAAVGLWVPLGFAQEVLIEERFNEDTGAVAFFRGAALGPEGSGVSGKPQDRAYEATADASETEEPGPAACLLNSPLTGEELQATLTFWYRSEGEQSIVSSPIAVCGFYLIFDRPEEFTVRLGTRVEKDFENWFFAGDKPPMTSWKQEGEWIFVAFTWDGNENKAVLYQGSPTVPVEIAADYPPRENGGSIRIGHSDGVLDTVGNNFSKPDGATGPRPFNGRIDNVRVFNTAFDQDAIERIRQADAEDAPLAMP